MENIKQNSFGNRTRSLAESCFTSDGESISMAARAPGFKKNKKYKYSQGSSAQAFEPTHAGCKPTSQGFKLQARGHKLQDPGTRVQAHKLRVRGSGYEDK